MSFTQDNQKVLVHTLIGFGKAGDHLNRGYPSLKVVSRFLAILTIVHLVDIMMGQVNSHLTI